MKSLNIDPDEVVPTADFVFASMAVSMERLSTQHQRSMSLRGLEQAITFLVHTSALFIKKPSSGPGLTTKSMPAKGRVVSKTEEFLKAP